MAMALWNGQMGPLTKASGLMDKRMVMDVSFMPMVTSTWDNG